MDTSKSKEFFEEAKQYIVGGVNSPVRAFGSVGGTPIFIESAKEGVIKDVDGNEYIDFVGSWGPMILGHSEQSLVTALQQKVAKGVSFGAPTVLEIELAKLITEMVPGIEKVRMVNSGTEACMSAVRVARGYTNREKIIKFEGCYHGHSDAFLIKAGSGALTQGTPDSLGVTRGTAQDTLLAKYNNIDDVQELMAAHKNEIAAVIIEPIAGNMGCIPPAKGFLEQLRNLCDQENIVLIFDEVMTGFRVASGGAQQLYGITADLVTFGKIIGGGLPVGAFGGKKEIMDMVAPLGDVYQAGTLSGNPLAMTSGYLILDKLFRSDEIYKDLEEKGAYLTKGLKEVFSANKRDCMINRAGSMFSFHFTDKEVLDFDNAQAVDVKLFNNFFHEVLQRNVYLPPSAFESLFISNAHTYDQLDQTISVFAEAIKAIK